MKCLGNYGWDAMHPDLVIGDGDLMPNSFESLYWLCKEKRLTQLIFMGVHTQVCLLGKAVGLRNMKSAGFECILARDLTDAHPDYDPETGLNPDDLTAETVAHFEKHLCSTINFFDELQSLGKLSKDLVVDPVRLTPWGTPQRPHLFDEAVVVRLSAPWQEGASIHYTTDGSEPTVNAPQYMTPLNLTATTRLRAIAVAGGEVVCLETDGAFSRRGAVPPRPDVRLSDLVPQRWAGPSHAPSDDSIRFSPRTNPPQRDLNNNREPLQIAGEVYLKGLGVHAPNHMIYPVREDYRRFVALAGVDDTVCKVIAGSRVAKHSSVVFRVFVDGKLQAESPIMRMRERPWRFDVKIPEGVERISLAVTDAGDGNKEDLADWVRAGFVRSARLSKN